MPSLHCRYPSRNSHQKQNIQTEPVKGEVEAERQAHSNSFIKHVKEMEVMTTITCSLVTLRPATLSRKGANYRDKITGKEFILLLKGNNDHIQKSNKQISKLRICRRPPCDSLQNERNSQSIGGKYKGKKSSKERKHRKRAKQKYLKEMAHQIRTALRVIINRQDQELTDKQKRKLQGWGRIKTIIQTDRYKET